VNGDLTKDYTLVDWLNVSNSKLPDQQQYREIQNTVNHSYWGMDPTGGLRSPGSPLKPLPKSWIKCRDGCPPANSNLCCTKCNSSLIKGRCTNHHHWCTNYHDQCTNHHHWCTNHHHWCANHHHQCTSHHHHQCTNHYHCAALISSNYPALAVCCRKLGLPSSWTYCLEQSLRKCDFSSVSADLLSASENLSALGLFSCHYSGQRLVHSSLLVDPKVIYNTQAI